MKKEKAVLKDGRTLDYVLVSDPPSGTMKEVFFTPDRRSVVCFYKDPATARDVLRQQRLENILGIYNPTLPKSQGGSATSDTDALYFRNLFCWPTGIVVKPRFGIVTPAYPSNFFFSEGPFKGQEKNGSWFTLPKPRSYLEKHAPAELGSWANFLKLCISMSAAVARLHTAGLAHSDLSPNNVLVDPAGGTSVVIDIDSLVVPGLFPPDVLGTKGFIAPEVLSTMKLPPADPNRKHPSARTDEHALAVLIYQYLLRRHPLAGKRIPRANSAEEQDFLAYGPEAVYCEHPTDDSNRPEVNPYAPATATGPYLSELFKRTFVEGLREPGKRPTSSEWLRGLNKTLDLLLPCQHVSCSGKWFVMPEPGPLRCPFCGTKPKLPVPVLRFRKEARPGNWLRDDGQLVLYDSLQLMKWHVFASLFPGPEVDRKPLAKFEFHKGTWMCRNESLTSMTFLQGQRVFPGQSVEITPGTQIRFSHEPNGRVAELDFVKP